MSLHIKTFAKKTFILIFLCTLVFSVVAQTQSDAELVDLMDVMLEDFLNPNSQAKNQNKAQSVERLQKETQTTTNKKAPVAQAELDFAEEIETRTFATQLPQTEQPKTTKPTVENEVPLNEEYVSRDFQITTNTQNKKNSTQTKTLTQEKNSSQVVEQPKAATKSLTQKNTTVQKNSLATAPKTEKAQTTTSNSAKETSKQNVATVQKLDANPVETTKIEPTKTVEKQEQNAQIDKEAAKKEAIAAANAINSANENKEKQTQETAIAEEVQEVPENDSYKYITVTVAPEYNSYNSKFKNIGGVMLVERNLKQNMSIGALAGAYYNLNKSNKTFEGELALFYRYYLMSDEMKQKFPYPFGVFLQPEVGIAMGLNNKKLIKDQLGLKPSPLVAFRAGYRGYLGTGNIFIEPYVRVGYPFIAGAGIGIGVRY